MTAEEFFHQQYPNWKSDEPGSDIIKAMVIGFAQQFASIQRKKQREICANIAAKWMALLPNPVEDYVCSTLRTILNKAPEPEF